MYDDLVTTCICLTSGLKQKIKSKYPIEECIKIYRVNST